MHRSAPAVVMGKQPAAEQHEEEEEEEGEEEAVADN